MTVKLRRDKGVALTFTELDDNFADYVTHRDKFDIQDETGIDQGDILAWDGDQFIPVTFQEAASLSTESDTLDTVTTRGNTTDNTITVGGLLPHDSTGSLGSADAPWADLYISGNSIHIGGVSIGSETTTDPQTQIESNTLLLPERVKIGDFLIEDDGTNLILPVGTTIATSGTGDGIVSQSAMETYVDEAIGDLVASAPDALNTLNELAAALGDDASFSTTVTTELGLKFNTSNFPTSWDERLAEKSTDDVSEGTTNLFLTEARVMDAVSNNIQQGGDISITYNESTNALLISTSGGTTGYDLSSNTTDDVTEGVTNLYFTDTRADGRIANASIGDLSDVDITTTAPAAGNTVIWDAVAGLFVPGDSFNQDDFNTAIGGISTDDVAEGTTNLYYTTARADTDFDTRIGTKSTDDLAEGANNLYYTAARFNANFTGKSTTELSEGTNLYYTDARVNTAFDTRLALKSTNDVAEGSTNLYYTTSRANTDFDTQLTTKTTDNVAEGTSNLYYTDDRANSAFDVRITTKSTDDVAEGTNNLYYTDARVRAALSGAGDVTYDSQTGAISVTTYKSSDFDNDFILKTTDSLGEGNSNLYYTDARVSSYLTTNSYATETDVNSAELRANSYTDTAQSTLQENIDGLFGTKTTNNLAEGTTNLYYTDARVRAAISVSGDLAYDSATGIISFSRTAHYDSDDFTSDLATKTTNDLAEGTSNLYYTDTRVDDRIALQVGANIDLSSVTTDNVAEGTTNLYYTNARATAAARGAITVSGDLGYNQSTGELTLTTYKSSDFSNDFGSMDTDNLTEGSNNLYYTDARVSSYLTTNSYATESYVDTAVSNLIDTAPEALDTLNELAAALGDDADFSTTVTNSIATKLATADFDTTADTWLTNQTTNLVAEGTTNLYYTDARARGAISVTDSGGDGSLEYDSSTGVITYTGPDSTAVRAHISADGTSGAQYNSETGVISLSSIPNDSLTNSSVTVNEEEVSLGGSITLNTDHVGEGNSNLYYTDARVGSYLTTNSYATESYVDTTVSGLGTDVDTAIDNLIDTAPTDLNTLNKLAAAINNDANYYSTVQDALDLKANDADISAVGYSNDYSDLSNKPWEKFTFLFVNQLITPIEPIQRYYPDEEIYIEKVTVNVGRPAEKNDIVINIVKNSTVIANITIPVGEYQVTQAVTTTLPTTSYLTVSVPAGDGYDLSVTMYYKH